MSKKNIPIMVCRILLGAVFVFSGFVKAVDPVGSAIKFGEYFSAFGMNFLHGSENFFAVLLSTFEMVLGLMLIFKIRLRTTAILATIFMVGLSMLTLFIALTDPVADCGCFGDAVKLSNWGTFIKNMFVLLPLSIIVASHTWVKPPVRGGRDIWWIVVFAAAGVALNIYSLTHLPLIDFLPYRVGVNIPKSIKGHSSGGDETKVIYRDRATGEAQEFGIYDTTWYDAAKWEYVDTKVGGSGESSARNFAILDAGEDITMELLDREGVLFILCVTDPSSLDADVSKALCDASREAISQGYRVIAVTPSALPRKNELIVDQNITVDYYSIDDVTLKSLLRARNGLVVVRDGTVADKMNSRDIPSPGKFRRYLR